MFAPTNPEQREENDLQKVVAAINETNRLLGELLDLKKQELAGSNPGEPGNPLGRPSGFNI